MVEGHSSSDHDFIVTCNCGATCTVGKVGLMDSVTCGVCGRKVRLTADKLRPAKAEGGRHSALFEAAMRGGVRERVDLAISMVRQKKYREALELYRVLLQRKYVHRDTIYGLGFCYYKRGDFQRSEMMLDVAAQMGHPAAPGLLQKVRDHIHSHV